MFNWKDYHQLALELELRAESDPLWEASLRSCVSRAYDGVFCSAVRAARAKGFVGNDHSAVRRHFQKRGKHSVANLLGLLQSYRELCDYRDSINDLPATVQNAKNMAEQLYRMLGTP